MTVRFVERARRTLRVRTTLVVGLAVVAGTCGAVVSAQPSTAADPHRSLADAVSEFRAHEPAAAGDGRVRVVGYDGSRAAPTDVMLEARGPGGPVGGVMTWSRGAWRLPPEQPARASSDRHRPPAVRSVRVSPGGYSIYGGKVATVSWSPSAGATGYLVSSRLMTDASEPWSTFPAPIAHHSWTLQPFLIGRRYQFRVQPVRGEVRGRPTISAVTRMHGIPTRRLYAALGDSYSAGLGGSGQDSGGSCHRNRHAWAYQLESSDQRATRLLACAGATMPLVSDQFKPMNRFFAKHPRAPQLITVTVGGNDVGFSKVLGRCVETACAGSESDWLDRITATRPLLAAFYREIRALHPYADIIAGGYPQVLEPKGESRNPLCIRINPPEREMLGRLSNHLNMVIAEAADDAGIWSVGLMVRQAFLGHNACTDGGRNWIHAGSLKFGGVSGIVNPKTFHPTDDGQLAYAAGFNTALLVRTS
ncbi:MAG: hypothetical protein JWP74_2320 [Marmoricola sp.]|nr:hypothetical protein [Marmoricola sp.]